MSRDLSALSEDAAGHVTMTTKLTKHGNRLVDENKIKTANEDALDIAQDPV